MSRQPAAAAFRENDIDESVLPTLTAEDLKELGVTANEGAVPSQKWGKGDEEVTGHLNKANQPRSTSVF
jgi:SAM domain (Sterile alpha motif)